MYLSQLMDFKLCFNFFTSKRRIYRHCGELSTKKAFATISIILHGKTVKMTPAVHVKKENR